MTADETDTADDVAESDDDGLELEEFDDLTEESMETSPTAKAKAARERLEAEADRAVEGFDENVVDLRLETPDGTLIEEPEIAIVIMIEHSGEGSEVAAPVFRRVVESYYGITPQRPYPWGE